MSFRFALAPLLRLRQSVERQRALRLREANLRVQAVQEKISALDRFLADSARADGISPLAVRTAAEIHFALISRENLLLQRQGLHAESRRLELERQRAAEEYQRAYREREVLQTLRTHQRNTYHQQELHREQRALDDTHLLQLWRKRLS